MLELCQKLLSPNALSGSHGMVSQIPIRIPWYAQRIFRVIGELFIHRKELFQFLARIWSFTREHHQLCCESPEGSTAL